jgi:hypothetical protein
LKKLILLKNNYMDDKKFLGYLSKIYFLNIFNKFLNINFIIWSVGNEKLT